MKPLKLPDFQIEIREEKVRCLIRKKWVALTPEEWVRQHFLNLLIVHLGYPRGMISLEYSLKYFKSPKRSDIVVLAKDASVFLLVECKSHEIKLNEKTLHQIGEYNKVLNAQYLAITNGISHFVWHNQNDHLKQLNTFPIYL